MKLCSRLLVLYCRNWYERQQIQVFDHHFEEVRGGVEPWSMARWKALAEFLLSVIELLYLSLTVEALQGKNVSKLAAFRRGWVSFSKISGVRGHPLPIY